MKKAVVVTKSEVRKILAEYFNVPIEAVWPSKYSFTVIQDEEENKWSVSDSVGMTSKSDRIIQR